MSGKIIGLGSGAEGLFIKNNRFNTTLVSLNFYLPLQKDTAAAFALLPFILTSCSKRYPDFSKLNYKLSRMYGARLDASTEKYGDYQLLRMTASVINDRFSLDGESLVKQATELLLGLVFEPSVEQEAFFENDIAREKRKAVEHIKGEFSEKRIYAKNRLIEKMYEGMPYGVAKCGTVEDVEKITGKSLYEAWKTMLQTAFIRVHVVGSAVPSGLFEELSDRFSSLERQNITDCKKSLRTESVKKPFSVTERMDINQGKLVIGFSSEMYGNDEQTLPLMIATDIFGGGPYSRLFSNVREKMSLCYYCSASATRIKGLVTVESGVETANAVKAEKEILNQLSIVKEGKFTDFEFNSSIKSISDSFRSFSDSQTSLDLWYALKVNNSELYSPEELAEKISAISKEDVTAAANGIKLHTVYKLLPKEVQ